MSEATATRARPGTGTAPAPQRWLDGLSRELLESGRLARLVAGGLEGVSANPAALLDEIGNCPAYQAILPALRTAHAGPQDRLDALLLPDVRRTCDLLAATYEGSNGRAGFVSVQLSPFCANDTAATVAAAQRLHAAVARPNLLVRVPATAAGIAALEELIYAGIGIDATLAFTPHHVAAVRAAHRRGLARRLQATLSVQRIACVASMPVALLDAAVDAQLGQCASHLRGKAGAACARLAWRDLEADTGFAIFAAFGAMPQLLAFTGATGAFIERAGMPGTAFVGEAGACASPPSTAGVNADLQHDIDQAAATVGQLARHGIDLETIGNDALATGLTQFERTHRNLLALMG